MSCCIYNSAGNVFPILWWNLPPLFLSLNEFGLFTALRKSCHQNPTLNTPPVFFSLINKIRRREGKWESGKKEGEEERGREKERERGKEWEGRWEGDGIGLKQSTPRFSNYIARINFYLHSSCRVLNLSGHMRKLLHIYKYRKKKKKTELRTVDHLVQTDILICSSSSSGGWRR